MLDEELTGYMGGLYAGPRVPSQQRPGPATNPDSEPGQRLRSADPSTQPYLRIRLAPISPFIGAVVEGVSLAEPLDAELQDELNRALLEWKVLFFKGQAITAADQQAFAANWGSLEVHPFFVPAASGGEGATPQVVRLEKDETKPGFENMWHTDVSWRSEPSLGSVLRAVEVPDVGGDTSWCDMAAAYDELTETMKERIQHLVAVHDWFHNFGAVMDPEDRDRLRPNFPPVEHPIVRVHPETGRKILYVNRIFTHHIVGMDEDESAELLDFLCARATVPEHQCRWRWEAGDVAFWDNRSTQHYANSDYFPNRRVMERITVIGDRPVGV